MPVLHITFTGSDCRTSASDLAAIAEASLRWSLPVEVAILLSPARCGADRYPDAASARRIAEDVQRLGLRLAVHACGSAARSLIAGSTPSLEAGWGYALAAAAVLGRVQLNLSAADSNSAALLRARAALAAVRPDAAASVIGQWRRSAWPEEAPGVAWLYDCSGGRGVMPSAWPALPPGRLVGLAGGLGPVGDRLGYALTRTLEHVQQYSESKVWLDMESNIRSPSTDGGTVFSAAKCVEVIEYVGRHAAA